MSFDVNFDHRLDCRGKNPDPDKDSPTLKKQHRLLWSKPLANGHLFSLEEEPGKYLRHRSTLGEFQISSDSISHSLREQKRMQHIIEKIPDEELDEFQSIGSVIGARIIFPGNRVDNHTSINQRRGIHHQINDRFDLTLECIRLHYLGQRNPLEETLNRYKEFFMLFKDFQGYIEFFLLQDLVSESSLIRFFLPHDSSFAISPRPDSVESYLKYKANSISFVKARNERIQNWVSDNL